jgi:transaldolase
VDRLLEENLRSAASAAERKRLQALPGRAGIANAKIAYEMFREIFGGKRFQALAAKGARVQRCLWASTGTKNPDYRDVMYVEDLLGPDTVNTMPQATLDAFRDHGEVTHSLDKGLHEAHSVMRNLADVGIDYKAVTAQLQAEGVQLFTDSYRKLLHSLEAFMGRGP